MAFNSRKRKTISMVPPLTPKGNPPVNITPPVVTGTVLLNSVLTTTIGTWTQNPVQYYLQWQRDRQDIPGAFAATYTVQNADLGHTIQCVVTAWNVDGPGYAISVGIGSGGGGGLGLLSLSSSSFTTGVSASGNILGATIGSVITSSDLPSGLTINSGARTFAWDGTGTASVGTFVLTETLAPYTPVNNILGYSISNAVTYDTAIGASVDANGYASLPLRVGAQRIYVANGGSNSNSGLTPSAPLADLATAFSFVVRNGFGDQVLLAEGSTFPEVIPFLTAKSGFSPTYPTVISSYDPADPTNEAKLGRGDQHNARPILSKNPTTDVNGGQVDNPGVGNLPNYIAIKGIDFNPGNVTQAAVTFIGHCDYILVENCILRYTAVSIDGADGDTVLPTLNKVIFRNNSSYGQWNSANQRTGGLYCAGYLGATVEDNVFYHTGWKIGASRDDLVSVGGLVFDSDGSPGVFSHPWYMQGNTNSICRRNLVMDICDSATQRGDADCYNNVFLRCPTNIGLGDGFSTADRPAGIYFQASFNLIMEAIDCNSTAARGGGWTTFNGVNGSRIHHNLNAYSLVESHGQLVGNAAASARDVFLQFDHNTAFHWNASGFTHYDGGGAFPANCHTTYGNDIWDDPTSGTNTNSLSATFTTPYTPSALYTAAGFADYTALVNYTIAHPEAHTQRILLSLALAGYGVTGSAAPTLTTLGLSTLSFTRGTPDSGAVTGAYPGSTIVASGLPAGLTINTTTRIWTWDGTGSGAASGSFTLTETQSGATNSGNATTISYSILAGSTGLSSLFTGQKGIWIDPSDLSTMFQTGTRASPGAAVTTDGQPVGLILDKSGNAYDLSQSTTTKRPLYKTDGTHSWLLFDGVDDCLVGGTLDLSAYGQLGAAVSFQPLSTAVGVVCELSPDANSTPSTFFLAASNDPATGQVSTVVNVANSIDAVNTTSSAYGSGVSSLISYQSLDITQFLAANKMPMRRNGISEPVTVGNETGGSGTVFSGTQILNVGGRNGGATFPHNGKIFGLFIRGGALSAGELSTVETFFTSHMG